MHNGIQKKLLLALVLLIIGSNIWVLVSVMNNRSHVSSSVVLSERELAPPWYHDEENNGVSLRMEYRVLAADDTDFYGYGNQASGWLTTEKMRSLGFNDSQLDAQNGGSSAGKEVFIALELNGAAYRQSIAILKQELADESDDKDQEKYLEKQLQREMHVETRLFAIDAETELSVLQGRYEELDNVFFVPGIIKTIDWHRDKSIKYKRGRIDSLSVSELHVPYPLNAKFKELGHRDYDDYQPSRYEVEVNYGKQLQPWIADVMFTETYLN